MMNRQDRRAVRTLVNIRWLPYVIPDSMLSAGEESDEQTHAYRKNQMNAEEANPARGVAGRPRKGCGAKAGFGGDFCFESRGYDYCGGRR